MKKPIVNIRIEKIGDVNYTYPYLEVFKNESTVPFLDIGIDENQLCFKFYASKSDVMLSVEELEYILITAKEFLPKALADEDYFVEWNKSNLT